MAKQSHTKNSPTTPGSSTNPAGSVSPSALTKFSLSFEYDRTWTEAKQNVQHRPSKK